MRTPSSLISLLTYLSLLLAVYADFHIHNVRQDSKSPTVTWAEDAGVELTNAQRIAMKLPLKKPKSQIKKTVEEPRAIEEQKFSGGTPRYTAHIVKRSAAAENPDAFNIALQPLSSGAPSKRAGGGIGWATVVEGQLSYTDSVELAAKFVWAAFLEGEMRALKWIPDDSQGVYQEGFEYAMYAVKNSGIWSTGFGNIPADAVSKFFDQVAETVFSPTFGIDSDTTATESSHIWIIDTSGQIHFAPDVSTAIAMYPGCSVALAQTIVPGEPAAIDAALGFQSSALTSAGKLYVLGKDGVGRWIAASDDGVLAISSASSATTFYFPSLGTSQPQKILFQQFEQTFTVTLADQTAGSAHLAGISGSSTPAVFNVPTNGRGVVTSAVGSASWDFYTDSDTPDDLSLCSSSTSCGATFQAICVELVPNGRTPSACAALLPKGNEKWLYATYVIGARKGWIGVNSDSKELEWSVDGSTTQPATFMVPNAADSSSQALGIKIDGVVQDVRLLKDNRNYPDQLATAAFVGDEWNSQYQNILSSAFVTVTADGFIKTSGGNWFRTFDFQFPLINCDGDVQMCSYAHEPICIETVDVGGTPSKCLGMMKDKIAKNPRQIYATSADKSVDGWLKLDGDQGFFKPVQRSSANTFYIPGLNNGSVAQEIYTNVNGGYNGWWGRYVRGDDWPPKGYGQFGVDPGTNGNEYNVEFPLESIGLGILKPDPNFNYAIYNGMSFYWNPDDSSLYLAVSDEFAKTISPNAVSVCLELVAEGSDPSACKASQPAKRWLWAEYTDGSGEGWVGYDTSLYMPALKWGIPESPIDKRVFYVPSTPSSGLDVIKVDISDSSTVPLIQTVTFAKDQEGRDLITTDGAATTPLFKLPTDSIGILTMASGTSFWTAPWFEPLYSCPDAGCGWGGPFQALCLELVEVGGTPSACAAKSKAKIEKNPTTLYAATSDGRVAAFARAGSDGVLKLDGTSSTATLFYVPGLNNGTNAQDTYAAFGTGYGKLWGSGAFNSDWRPQGFSNIRTGYTDSASFELPIVYPNNEFGIIMADNSFYTDGWAVVGALTYYVNFADLTIHAFDSPATAASMIGSNIAPLCIESVAQGGTPGKCAASFPRESGPSYLYATGDGGADSGYISVNTNTGRITWARTQSTSTAATIIVPQLGSTTAQELRVKMGDSLRPLSASPSAISSQMIASSDTTARPASLFNIPSSGAGIITADFGFYTSILGFPIYGCNDNKCGSSTPQSAICIEIVPAGSSPGACLAQALTATAKNGMKLYARSSDGSVAGYVNAGVTSMTPVSAAADATTFYVPTYGNGSSQHDTYALASGAYQKIWTSLYRAPSANRVVSTNKLGLGKTSTSGGNMIPLTYPASSVYGAVTAYNAFWPNQALGFYLDKASTDKALYAAPNDADAAFIGNNVVKLCVESVPLNGSPRVCTAGSRKRGPLRVDEWGLDV